MWEVEPGSWCMWSDPSLHLVEILLDIVCGKRFPILETYALPQSELKSPIVEPACIGGKSRDNVSLLVDADRFLHRVPGDEQPVQRRGIDDVNRADRRMPLPLRGVSHIRLLSKDTRNVRARFMEWNCADTDCTLRVWASSKYELFRDYSKKALRGGRTWSCYVENLVVLKSREQWRHRKIYHKMG